MKEGGREGGREGGKGECMYGCYARDSSCVVGVAAERVVECLEVEREGGREGGGGGMREKVVCR